VTTTVLVWFVTYMYTAHTLHIHCTHTVYTRTAGSGGLDYTAAVTGRTAHAARLSAHGLLGGRDGHTAVDRHATAGVRVRTGGSGG
jgi:hypothetical protein